MSKTCMKRAKGLHFARVGDEYFLTSESDDVVALVNQSAFLLLSRLNGRADTERLARQLGHGCGQRGDPKYFVDASKKLCASLLDLGLLKEIEFDVDADPTEDLPIFEKPGGDIDPPEMLRHWNGDELAGSLLVHSSDGDIRVITPNVTEGPITTCPSNTCTVPAGLFGKNTLIRVFDSNWKRQFRAFECRGGLHG